MQLRQGCFSITQLRLFGLTAINLYQAGDHYGCYRVFQGILITLKPVLADQPALQKSIDDGLAEAARQPQAWQRAWALRRFLSCPVFRA